MQCFFSGFLLFSFLVSLSYGSLECHDVQCPIQEFYVDGRSGSNFKFVPCRTCALCREGNVHQFLQVMITGDTCNHVNCGNDNDSLTINITKATRHENCSLELDVTYHCYKPGGDSNVYIPLLEDKHITVHVQLKVLDVELRAIANQSTVTVTEEFEVAKYTEGETVKLTCKVKGPIPSGSVPLMYFHHSSNAITIACSDHEGSSLHIHGKTTKSERSCELLIVNSQVINSGDYFCHVYLTGQTDLGHELESNTVTVHVAVHPNTADAMLHLGLEIGVPSGFVIVVLVVLLVATLVIITFQRRGRGCRILNPPPNHAAAQNAGVGYSSMGHTHAHRRLQQQPDGSSGQELVQSQDDIIDEDRFARRNYDDFEYESDTGPVPVVAIRQRIPRGQQSVSLFLSGERNPNQPSEETVPLITNEDGALEAALSDHSSTESSKPSVVSLPQGDSNIDGGEETLDT